MTMRARVGFEPMIARAVVVALMGATLCLNAGAQAQSSGKSQITNVTVEAREVKAGLAQEVDAWAAAAEKAQWLGYSVPAVAGDHHMCCGGNGGDWNGWKACSPCQLEGSRSGDSHSVQGGDVKLEGPSNIVVLFRAEGRKIRKIR